MKPLVAFCGVLGLASLSAAQPVQFLASDGNRLYRGDLNGNVSPFITLSADIQSLTRVPEGYSVAGASAGDIIATAADGASGLFRVYRLNDPFGAASLTPIGSTTISVGSMTFAPDGLYAANASQNPIRVSKLDPASFSIVQTYSTGIAVSGTGGIAYHPALSSFYITDATNHRLMAWSPSGGASVVGGVGFGFSNNGLEFLNGTLYGALRLDSPGSQMRVGTFNVSTGAFTSTATFGGILGNGTGFVTIPAPGASALIGLGGLLAARRRR